MTLFAESNIDSKVTMNLIEAIYSRRAVRRYSNRRVTVQAAEELITAAIQAPSAMNKQPWAFVVIQNRDLLDRVCSRAKELLMKDYLVRKESEHGKTPFDDPNFDIF